MKNLQKFVRWPLLGISLLLAFAIMVAGCQTYWPPPDDKPCSKCLAVVIGNSQYTKLGALVNPTNDADDIAGILKQANYTIYGEQAQKDLGQSDIDKILMDIKDNYVDYRVVLFYFSGHGVDIGGEQYILPTDLDPQLPKEEEPTKDQIKTAEKRITEGSISLDKITSNIAHDNRASLVILDACRNDPFAIPRPKAMMNVQNYFKPMQPSEKVKGLTVNQAVIADCKRTVINQAVIAERAAVDQAFIAYGTAKNFTASDISPNGRNGLFTYGLIQGLQDRTLVLRQVMVKASESIEPRQTPQIEGASLFQEGRYLTNDLMLMAINKEGIVLQFKGYKFFQHR